MKNVSIKISGDNSSTMDQMKQAAELAFIPLEYQLDSGHISCDVNFSLFHDLLVESCLISSLKDPSRFISFRRQGKVAGRSPAERRMVLKDMIVRSIRRCGDIIDDEGFIY